MREGGRREEPLGLSKTLGGLRFSRKNMDASAEL